MGILRLLLALAVVVGHMAYFDAVKMKAILNAQTAVSLFFIISGFYMGMILNEKYRSDAGGTKAFFQNRFLRLYPTYIVVLLATVAWHFTCVWFTEGRTPTTLLIVLCRQSDFPTVIALCFSNISMIGLDILSLFQYSPDGHYHFIHGSIFGPTIDGTKWVGDARWIGQAWSIGAEIWFYLLAPFLVRKPIWKILLAVIVSLGIQYIYKNVWNRDPYWLWPAQFWLFLLGVLIYRAKGLLPVHRGATRPLGFLAIAVTIYLVVLGPLLGHKISVWSLYAFMIVLVPSLFNLTKFSSLDRLCGDLSYPIYIVHMLVQNVSVVFRKRMPMDDPQFMIFVITATIIASLVLVHYIEAPIERWRTAVAIKGGLNPPHRVSPNLVSHNS